MFFRGKSKPPPNPPTVTPPMKPASFDDDFESDGGEDNNDDFDSDEGTPPPDDDDDDADEDFDDENDDDDDDDDEDDVLPEDDEDFEDAEEFEDESNDDDDNEGEDDDPPGDEDFNEDYDEEEVPPDDDDEGDEFDEDEEEDDEDDLEDPVEDEDENEDEDDEFDEDDDDLPSPPPAPPLNVQPSRVPPPLTKEQSIRQPPPPLNRVESSKLPPPPSAKFPQPPSNDDDQDNLPHPPLLNKGPSANTIAKPVQPIKPPLLIPSIIPINDNVFDSDEDEIPPPPPEKVSNIPFAKVDNDNLSTGLNISNNSLLRQDEKRQSASLTATLFNSEALRNSLSLSKSLVVPNSEIDNRSKRFSSRMSFINNSVTTGSKTSPPESLPASPESYNKFETEKKEKEGYLEVQGKFEGDPFEILFIKPTKSNMFVRVITGEEASFDLTKNAYVYEDIDDPKCFVLDYAGNMMVFKVKTLDEMTAILAAMPKKVFEAPADNDPPPPPEPIAVSPALKVSKQYSYPDEENDSSKANVKHVKGTSVEELLEGNIIQMNSDELDQIFVKKSSTRRQSLFTIESIRKSKHKRKELINTYIKKPIVSIRRVKQLCKWINSLHVWEKQVTILNLHKNFCNGILLYHIITKFHSSTININTNYKILNEKTAMENIENCLGIIKRSKNINISHIPKAIDLFKGNIFKLVILLQELFDVYVRKPLYNKAIKILKWYTSVLRQYSRPLPLDIFMENDLSNLWSYFQSGVSIFNVLYHFNGPVTIGQGKNRVTIDPLRITNDPKSISEFRANTNYVFSLLETFSIEILWDADDWITYPDTEFVLLQLQLIYDKFSLCQCSLPPANGTVAGITSGPNGEPRVVGLIYADTLLSNRVSVERMARGVLVGIGEDALPLLPIDNSHLVKSRYYAPTLPQGLMSFMVNSVKVIHSSITLRDESKKSKDWNSSHAVDRVSRDHHHKDEGLLHILRNIHKPVVNDVRQFEITKDPNSDTISTSKRKARQSVVDRSIGIIRRASVIPQVTLSTLDNVKSIDELNKLLENQFQDLMETLDSDLQGSYEEMAKQEDDLISRYNELEEISERVSQKDYERILNQLENEKLQLENERIKVKEHYELRKVSITKQHNETASRMRIKFEENSKANEPKSNRKQKKVEKTRTAFSKPHSSKVKDLAVVEKGWIQTFTKKNTHNIHLNRMQSQSINNVQATWTPTKYKGDNKQTSSNMKALTLNELSKSDNLSDTKNDMVQSFQLFKIYLHNITQKWNESQKPAPPKLDNSQELSSSKSKIANTLITVPNKPTLADLGVSSNKASEEQGIVFDSISVAIRNEENDRLQYEDERRRTYLAQVFAEQNGYSPSNMHYDNETSLSNQTDIDYSTFDDLPNDVKLELENAISFLETPRKIRTMNEEYSWKIVKSKNLANKLIYSLQWSNLSDNKIVGLVDILSSVDIFESVRDPLTLTLILGNSLESLKSTFGKPFLYLKFQSKELCHQYKLALKCLQKLDV